MPLILNKNLIIEHTSREYFNRGKVYFHQGRVKNAALDQNTISGKVLGRQLEPYRVDIDLDDKKGGITYSICTCPLRARCKHVAAMALKALDIFGDTLSDHGETKQSSKKDVAFDGGANDEELDFQDKYSFRARETGWKSIFAPLAAEHQHNLAATHQVEVMFNFVEEETWNSDQSMWKLKVRPRMVDVHTGKPSLSMLQWKDLRHAPSYKFQTAPVATNAKLWLVDFFRHLSATDHYGNSASWLSVDGNQAAGIWSVLRRHREAGVQLIFGENPSFDFQILDRFKKISVRVNNPSKLCCTTAVVQQFRCND